MSTTLKAALFSAASSYAPLTALLTTGSEFAWYDTQKRPDGPFPAIAVQVISNPRIYAFNGRLATSFARVQFTIWGTNAPPGNNDSQLVMQIEETLLGFLQQFNGSAVANLPAYSNLVLNARDGMFVEADPPIFQRLVDAQIFWNES